MSSDTLPNHIDRPHLRPIQPVPVQKDGQSFVALRDPAMLSGQTMVVPAPALRVLQLFRGEQSLDELAVHVGGQREQLEQLARGLDQVGLLWGPTFEKLEKDRWTALESSGSFPIRASRMLGEDATACRTRLSAWFDQTEDPELDGPVRAIVAPHLDYERGWPNYAASYYMLRNTPAPDRVIVLGTNHFGMGDGVVVTQLGFETPLGKCPPARDVLDPLVERLGRPAIVDQLDHMPEHSIELQVPWLQYCFGDVPVMAALVPDPTRPPIADDGERVMLDPFVATLRAVLDEIGGNTLFVASSDLSHVGPQFGEPRPVDDQRRMDVERHDREMMAKFIDGDAEEFVAAMKWNRNPTRWCSVGNMTALLQLVQPETIELVDYRQACDERGVTMVSSASLVLC